jgi:hypothetical protein
LRKPSNSAFLSYCEPIKSPNLNSAVFNLIFYFVKLLFGKNGLSPAYLVASDLFEDMLLSAWYATSHNIGTCGEGNTTKIIHIVTCEIKAFDLDKTNKILNSGTN